MELTNTKLLALQDLYISARRAEAMELLVLKYRSTDFATY